MEDDDYFDGVDYFTKIEEMNLILGKEGEKKGNLYQGGIMAAESVQKLKDNHITAVLTVASGSGLNYQSKGVDWVRHKQVEAYDSPTQSLYNKFSPLADWIKEELEKGNVLVHCMAGVSRSSTITLAYMMKHLDYKLDHALALLRVRRPIASPNSGFMSQLRMYENKLSEAAKRGGGAQGDKKAT